MAERTRPLARALLAAVPAGLAWACGLLAPFDLGALPSPADGDAATDGGDGDAAADGGDAEADSRADADGPPWDPLAGCVGGGTEERWLVASVHGGVLRSHVTGRDCASPELLCEGCFAMAFSPSGALAAAIDPPAGIARTFDEILVLDAVASDHPVLHRGFHGALPAWLDDDTLLYVKAPEDWAGTCWSTPPAARPEVVDLVRRDLASGADEVVASGLRRAWTTCCPVVAADGLRVALGENLEESCARFLDAVAVVDLATGRPAHLAWTVAGTSNLLDAPIGLLPDGSGLVVQTLTSSEHGLSTLYATSFDGETRRLVDAVPAAADSRLLTVMAPAFWAHCATVRRFGPACEAYCRDPATRGWVRHPLGGGASETVDCSELPGEVRIMDVRQVPAD